MDIVINFLKSIPSVTTPLTLIAFIVVALLTALLLVLKSTKGLERIQDLMFKEARLTPSDIIKIINRVLLVLLAITAMLFSLLAYDYHTNMQRGKMQTGSACYAETCTGRDPKDAGCDKGADTMTSTLANLPEAGKEFKGVKVEIRYSPRCHASWIRIPPVIGSTIYFEDKAGKQHVPFKIQDDGIKDFHFTEMVSADFERRACIDYPGKKRQCTGFIK
jgi:Protein of unknown function (DUF2690)